MSLCHFSIIHNLYLDVKIGLQRVLFNIILYPNCEINWFFKERLSGSPPYFSKIKKRMLNAFVKVSSVKHSIPDKIFKLMLSNNSAKSSTLSGWLFRSKSTWNISSNPDIVSLEVMLKQLVELEILSIFLVHWDIPLKNKGKLKRADSFWNLNLHIFNIMRHSWT